jgi:RNA polymerase sigma factor (sigma-70 family)
VKQRDESDAELLSRYLQTRNEAAFTELVNRHVRLVYSTACRENNGDASAAEDVTQLVFIELARKAGRLTQSTGLAGWLYMSVRHVSANRRREQLRRTRREQKACMMDEPQVGFEDELTWETLAPVLDDVLHDLNEQDRHAVVLRYLEGNTLQKVGAALGLTENAARMRVERALDKLRNLLAKRGVRSSASALTIALAAVATASTPPASLASTVASGALASSTSGVTSLLASLLTAPVKVGIVTAVVMAGVAVPSLVHRFSSVANQAGSRSTDAVLSGAMLFSTDPAGNPAGNLVWDTRGTDSDFYKVWLSQGAPGGNPDGLTTALLNGPQWAAAPIQIRLHEGTNRFTLFFQHDGKWPTMGLNLFFNSNVVPAITAKATGRSSDQDASSFSENRARRTYSLTSYPSPNVRAIGLTATSVLAHRVELTEFYHVITTNFFGLDRVSSHAAQSDGRPDCVATFTLVVGPRSEQAQLGASGNHR